MITVINAGGSGTRLWPLSTPDYPKQLLTIVGEDSLLQMAYKRALAISSPDKIYVIPEKSHAHFVREQLPELPEDQIIVEPGRRGTAGCIIAGLYHVQSRHDHDEPIAFIHSDHVIRDVKGFANSFKQAGEASSKEGRVTLIGIEPDYPATGFGYIHTDGEISGEGLVYNVAGFKEKPEFDVAQEYLQSGQYLWNCGYFVGSVNTFDKAFTEFSPKWKGYYDQLLQTTDEKTYEDTYLSFENDTIDYALLEHMTNLLVTPAAFDWKDVGSFKDAHDVVEKDQEGNYMHGDVEAVDVTNSFVRNDDSEKPVAVIGLDNVVVVNTPQGILVARKDLSQKVGDIAKKIQGR
jgi:mannose-1-phosphate guanylyltransferase/mannose-6-phosphate isomerase